MKKSGIKAFVLCIALLLPIGTFGQNKIKYGYDAAGNRISRTIVLNAVQQLAAPQEEPVPAYRDLFADININIYPNPTKGHLVIQIDGKKAGQTMDIVLYDMSGKVIIKKTNLSATTDIDISGQPAGNYVMKFFSGDRSTEWKIIKE